MASILYLGRSQTGKTEAINREALKAIRAGLSVFVLADKICPILERIPKSRWKDVIVINPALQAIGLNFFHEFPDEKRVALARAITEGLLSLWYRSDMKAANIEMTLGHAIKTLLAIPSPDNTFLHIEPLLTNPAYRRKKLKYVTDPAIRYFWDQYERKDDRRKDDLIDSTLNKIRNLASEPLIRNCIGQEKNYLSFEGKVVLIELPENRLGRENSSVLGTLLVAYLSASGVETSVFIDDAERFGPAVMRDLIDTVDTQLALNSLRDLREPEILTSAVDEIVAFRTTAEDDEELHARFNLGPTEHLYDLGPFEAKTTLDKASFSMPELNFEKTGYADRIVARNLGEYTTRQQGAIDELIAKIYELPPKKEKPKKKPKKGETQ